ncbi:ribonuclease P protein component [Mariniluteicoccus flavus]
MLPSRLRMRSSLDFQRTVRQGVRAGRPTLVVHARRVDVSEVDGTPPVRVGFVVSKGVGNAVVRSRVKRRLRHLALPLAQATAQPLHVVVRALPASAEAADLTDDLGGAWARASAKAYA